MNEASDEPGGEKDAALPADLSKELDAVNAELGRLTAENEELRRALGEPISPPKPARPRKKAKGAAGGYRAPDARARLEEELDAANAAVASLSIDNSILQSRVDETKPSQNATKIGRWILAVVIVLAGLGTVYAVVESPDVGGPTMLILVAIATGIYAVYGWLLFLANLGRSRVSRQVRAQKVTPIAGAPTGQSLVVGGVVHGRDAAFDAWFPDGQRAVWQAVRVTELRRRSSHILAELQREVGAFHVVDADGGSVRIEPANAEIVPEAHAASGFKLSQAGKQGLLEIRRFEGDRDALSVNVELVRLGASVLVEGSLSRDPEPVMRSTKKTPLKIVVLGREGVDDATRSALHGRRVGVVAGAITVALCLAIAHFLSNA